MTDHPKDYMSHHVESNCLIVKVKSHFDERNCFQVQNDILGLLEKEPAHLLLDLNDVCTIRSSGLRVILSITKDFQNKKEKFFIVYSKNDDNQQVSQILKVSGFTKIISICATIEEAIKYCSVTPS
ncbi:MAG: STAS domain-containing protein [Oligoflexia bacterium]|nr:STAS domain-containing protein [Oligoflexia bacterium]